MTNPKWSIMCDLAGKKMNYFWWCSYPYSCNTSEYIAEKTRNQRVGPKCVKWWSRADNSVVCLLSNGTPSIGDFGICSNYPKVQQIWHAKSYIGLWHEKDNKTTSTNSKISQTAKFNPTKLLLEFTSTNTKTSYFKF